MMTRCLITASALALVTSCTSLPDPQTQPSNSASRSARVAPAAFASGDEAAPDRISLDVAETTPITWTATPTSAPFSLVDSPAFAAAPRRAGKDRGTTEIKLGYFSPIGDVSGLDNAYSIEISHRREIISLLAVEVGLGWIKSDGSDQGFTLETQAVPLTVNLRAQVPITILELYAGVGIGVAWVDFTAGPVQEDEFTMAYDAFLGAKVDLGPLGAGIEGKYIVTDEIQDFGDRRFEGTSVSLFASLRF